MSLSCVRGHTVQHSFSLLLFTTNFLDFLFPSPLSLWEKKCFLTFAGSQSESAVSKVTSDFLISRAKAAFYFLPPRHVADYPQNPFLVDLSSYIFDYASPVPFDGFFFLLSYCRQPRDSVFGFLFFYLPPPLSFFFFPLSVIPKALLCLSKVTPFFKSLRPKSLKLSLTVLSIPDPTRPHILSVIASKSALMHCETLCISTLSLGHTSSLFTKS